MLNLCLIVAIFALSSQLANATATVNYRPEGDHSSFKVMVPGSLKSFATADGLKHSQALFGTPSYGNKKITGRLFYVTPGDEFDGCALEKERVDAVAKDEPHKIFMVDRGDCDFVVKMKVAQDLGAVAVIIADNVCQCENVNAALDPKKGITQEQKTKCEELAHKAQQEGRIPGSATCEKGLPFMADDGTGAQVNIPSFLIDYMDAQPLKDCFQASQGVPVKDLVSRDMDMFQAGAQDCAVDSSIIVSLEWDLPTTTGKVNWELWSSSDSEAVFKKDFAETAMKLSNHVNFTPRYFVWDGRKWGCTVGGICGSQCTQGGFYCNPDPDHNLFNGVSGKDVVEENLRELCIWEQAEGDNQQLWWKYVTTFADRCHPKKQADRRFNVQCSEEAQQAAGVNVAKVRTCVEKSWHPDHKKNTLLEEQVLGRESLKILQLPTAIVNGVLLRGGVTAFSILSTICHGFKSGMEPELCSCVEKASSSSLLQCIHSKCSADQRLCNKDGNCYAASEYVSKCSGDVCHGDPNQSYCSSIAQCLSPDVDCPECPDETKPHYCSISESCVSTPVQCTPTEEGTSALGVIMITMIIVSLAGCGAYVFWRRQKARLHDDVRNILNSYMALEESDDSDRVSRPTRRADPPSSDGANPVSGSDAATYI